MNIRLTAQEFEEFKRRKNPEVYTKEQIGHWVEACKETLMKGDAGEANDIEKAEIDNFKAELQSFMQVKVVGQSTDPLIKGLQYDTYFVRPQQVEWEADEIVKSEDGKEDIQKSRVGKYTNTSLNRKMGRVGAQYGKKKDEDEVDEDKETIKRENSASKDVIHHKDGTKENFKDQKDLENKVEGGEG